MAEEGARAARRRPALQAGTRPRWWARHIETAGGIHPEEYCHGDVDALHTWLVPGFVADSRMDGAACIVTFASGMTARERSVVIDDTARRVVWSAVVGA